MRGVPWNNFNIDIHMCVCVVVEDYDDRLYRTYINVGLRKNHPNRLTLIYDRTGINSMTLHHIP